MSIDNPGVFYLAENFGEEKNDNRPVTIYGNQLFKKSIDLLNITRTITDVLPDDEEEESGACVKDLMMQNAIAIPSKIKAAHATDIYSIKMENAVIIKVNIQELKDQIWVCEEVYDADRDYIRVLTDEIVAFKAIFIDWIKSFDKMNDLPDDWHLFNDPTSFPDDDEPFDAEDFSGNYNPDDDV